MKRSIVYCILLTFITGCVSNTSLDSFQNKHEAAKDAIMNPFTFQGYTDHWQDSYRQQYRYGNLYKINMPDLAKTILQSKIDIAEAMGIRGLQMQEGFFNGLVSASYTVLEHPSVDALQTAVATPRDDVNNPLFHSPSTDVSSSRKPCFS